MGSGRVGLIATGHGPPAFRNGVGRAGRRGVSITSFGRGVGAADTFQLPSLISFGGVRVFGVLGLIVGPVIAAVALAMLRTYDREMCEPASGPS